MPLHGGEQYLTVTIATRGAAVGGPAEPASGDGCGYGAELASKVVLTGEDGAVDGSPIAVTGDAVEIGGDQPGEELSTQSAEYRALAAQALAIVGIDDPDPALEQLVRTDLHNDGTDDVLLVAERFSRGNGPPGDYSVLVLRELVGGEVETHVLHDSVAGQRDEAGHALMSMVRVAGLVDINGDGSLEVVVTYRFGRSIATSDIDTSGSTPRQVLTAQCPN